RSGAVNLTRLASAIGVATVLAVVFESAALSAQAPKSTTAVKTPAWSPARTPWGDTDLQGAYTNKDENGIPMERPNQFQGKTIEQVRQSELGEIVKQRQQEAAERAPGI